MKVFITGATGYVGFNVASAFRRAGHEVWGLARSEEKARMLVRNEIHPVIGNMQKPESYTKTAEDCSILVHTASAMNGDMINLDKRTVEAFLNASKTKRLLSWTPRHEGFVDGIETYFAAWMAWLERVKQAELKAA